MKYVTVEALLMDILVSGHLYLLPPSQNPVFLNSHTNSAFLHCHKQPAPVNGHLFRIPRVSAHESVHCIFRTMGGVH